MSVFNKIKFAFAHMFRNGPKPDEIILKYGIPYQVESDLSVNGIGELHYVHKKQTFNGVEYDCWRFFYYDRIAKQSFETPLLQDVNAEFVYFENK